MREIRKFARAVADQFDPDRIILFGSYAYGTPHANSDVDILVVMPCADQHVRGLAIRNKIPRLFSLDLIVRTPENLAWRLAEGESFHSTIIASGKVLYEKDNSRVGSKGRKQFQGLRTGSLRCNNGCGSPAASRSDRPMTTKPLAR